MRRVAQIPLKGRNRLDVNTTSTRIVIGICTRGRDALLRRLIDSILLQQVPRDHDVSLLIVDNNDHPQVQSALHDLGGPFPIEVVHEGRVGLVHARNRVLDEAASRGADWFIGVDDDEWVAEDWLAQFITGMKALGRPILLGHCQFVHDESLSPYVPPMQFSVRKHGRRPSVYAAGNFALRRDMFDQAHGPGLRFDPAFNESGGEDSEFLLRAELQYGLVPASWPDAVVFEDWVGVRATLRHRMRREWRVRCTWYRIAWLHCRMGLRPSYLRMIRQALGQLIRNLVYGAIGLVVGVAMLLVRRPIARKRIGRALLRLARAYGIIAFFLGVPVRTYTRR